MGDGSSSRPRLVVISAVLPFPGHSGQQQRVRNKLLAFRDYFHTTFLTVATAKSVEETRNQLETLCDEAIVLPSVYRRSRIHRCVHLAESVVFAAATGLKRSNYVVGELELAPKRIAEAVGDRRFDVAVFEYWHAASAVPVMRTAGARCVLDMHDVLWRSYDRQLKANRWVPNVLRNLAVARYRSREERAWRSFDALITINQEEHQYVEEILGDGTKPFFTPMGVDLRLWPYSWTPVEPPRVAYYGGLGSLHNQRDALFCYEQIMPVVWSTIPEAEYWIIGSKPPPAIRGLGHRDPKVHVTGFVEDVAPLLATMSVVLCPWTGTYGFRSRIVEVMAVGVPVVASVDCVDGMGFQDDHDVLLASSPDGMAQRALAAVQKKAGLNRISISARKGVEKLYSFEKTYGALAGSLSAWKHVDE